MGIEARLSVEQPKSTPTVSCEIAVAAVKAALGQKARDVRGVDLRGITDIADYFVVASGNSNRHVRGIADRVKDALQELGEEPNSIAGYENAEWILLDYGNVIIHIFYEPMRNFYNLDEVWRAGTTVPLPEPLESEAKQLRTGMF